MIDIERRGPHTILRFNRPKALNALNAEGMSGLETALDDRVAEALEAAIDLARNLTVGVVEAVEHVLPCLAFL